MHLTRLALVLIVVFVVAVAASSVLAYELGIQSSEAGYKSGFNAGFAAGQEGLVFQWNSYIPLSPGAQYGVDLSSIMVGNTTDTGYVDFVVDCPTINYCPSGYVNGTVELYIQYGQSQILYSTGFVKIESTFLTVKIPPSTASATFVYLEANPQNKANLAVFWETPFVLRSNT
jgi:hypothetical protein